MNRGHEMTEKHYMVVDLLRAFYWFDDGLQNYLRSRGWPTVPRTQSMILMNVMSGINRSAEIARNLGVTRQAIHITISQMVDADLINLEDDPSDGRSKCVVLSATLEPMRRDARVAIDLLTQELHRRLGPKDARGLSKAFEKDWGPTLDFEAENAATAQPAAGRAGRPRKDASPKRQVRASPGSRKAVPPV